MKNNTMTINCTTNYVAPQVRRVSNKVGKTEDHSSIIRLATFAMAATAFGYIAFKTLSSVGVM